ncbi:Similar to S.cerevisiae protein ARC18 (Subunit of the ARP2/3 complex) [Malassezia sympodialis ATCC 42132]|uniref:Actin-related protein 2/3 complex subunit 3 n=1 Tax=Malassezia sympodialis (strain ATCC 42132) TaxID=1230383 RepID=A0A1M8A0H2_MALS4|nr:Similar to S.cerevisiae protein ARC18 (Subunit of the ARP2/3 complex) [Malassezia sympodialis ATCC 42132]
MPAYHSSYNDEPNVQQIAGVALLPIHSRSRGPAPLPIDPSRPDIVDEAIDLFRANSLFRNFEIQGAADRTLIYLILFISDCLTRIASAPTTWSKHEAQKQLLSYAVDHFALPGDANFPLTSLYGVPGSRAESDTLRQYLVQARQETVVRLLDKIYVDNVPSRWWLAFTKRKFMGKSLS